jgi:hypothetical protein
MGGAEGNMRMICVQYDDEARYVYQLRGIEDKCTRTVSETRGKKHEDMKHTLELQVRESSQVGFAGEASHLIPIGHHFGTRLAIPYPTSPSAIHPFPLRGHCYR